MRVGHLKMSEASITKKTLEEAKKTKDLTDWDKVNAMSESEIESNALSDLDNQILSPENLKNVRRINRKQYNQNQSTIQPNLDINTVDKQIKDFIENNYIPKMTNDSEKYLLLQIVDRYIYHFDGATKAKGVYETINWLFSICIPVYSAILTFILAGTFESIRIYLPFLGLGLTILTILSSVLKPDERSTSASEILITLNDWKISLIVGLNEHIEHKNIEKKEILLNFLVNKNDELTKLGETIIQRFIPTVYNFK